MTSKKTPATAALCLAVAAALLALPGCSRSGDAGNGGADLGRDGPVTAIGGEPRILVHRQALAPDAAVAGKLEYRAAGRCLVVSGKRAERDYVAAAVWPDGVEPVVRDSRHGVDVPGFGGILAGDGIKAGGTFWKPDDPRVKRAVRGLDPACLPEGGFLVLNADSFEPAPTPSG
ncbi:hypothetical protein [Streptomyces sp. NPDC097619]|uniref:hypothetical protein n=1 Tax=Streptomyces sp. NPDC097619 TaxID=3157228 RepID=UPI003321C62F